jgi:hypothetical protein
MIIAVETESTKNQPVDIWLDLFKIEHQWVYLNCKLLSDIFSSIRVPKQTLDVKYLHLFYIITFENHVVELLSIRILS